MTRAGYNKLREQLNHMENEEMPAIEIRIAEARAEGDLRENAEYHGARESQGMLQAKINLLRDKLNRANIINTSNLPKDEVGFGLTVILNDLDLDDEEEYTLVGAGEEDPISGRILLSSPFAQAMLGKKKGERFVVETPKGNLNYEILDIVPPDEE
jgi:transcription elongation factor GreA